MADTLVTNQQWLEGIDGKPRYVQLMQHPRTLDIRVEDVMARPPSHVDFKINLDAGGVAVEGSYFLVKLVDAPSAKYYINGRDFSRPPLPVVGTNHFQRMAWVRTHPSGRMALPTDVQWQAVATHYGKQPYGTSTGYLYADGHKLGHFGEWDHGCRMTAGVYDPRYPAGPYGVHSQFNAWRPTMADPRQPRPYGMRGASFMNNESEGLAASRRDFIDPFTSCNNVGLQPVLLWNLPE
jgi:hypothetical protein